MAFVEVTHGAGKLAVNIDHIVSFKHEERGTVVHLSNGEEIVVAMRFEDLRQLVDAAGARKW